MLRKPKVCVLCGWVGLVARYHTTFCIWLNQVWRWREGIWGSWQFGRWVSYYICGVKGGSTCEVPVSTRVVVMHLGPRLHIGVRDSGLNIYVRRHGRPCTSRQQHPHGNRPLKSKRPRILREAGREPLLHTWACKYSDGRRGRAQRCALLWGWL